MYEHKNTLHKTSACDENYTENLVQENQCDGNLLPCPFCGGKAEYERKGTARASMIITCENCGCSVESGDVYEFTDTKFYTWNKRVGN